jgi:hypothetical protein
LLGLSIDNTAEVHSFINVTISIKESFETLEKLVFQILDLEKSSLEFDGFVEKKFDYIN